MNVYSLCDPAVWDKARWYGTMFAYDRSGDGPPLMGLMFRNVEAGKEIFRSFRQHVGVSDKAGLIRVSIVEGDIPGEKPGYSVVVGLDTDKAIALDKVDGVNKSRYVATINRFHRVNPVPGSPHLPKFKAEFARHNQYKFMPAGGTDVQPEPILDLAIEKYAVNFKRVEDLEQQDFEHCVLKKTWIAPDLDANESGG